MGKGGREAAGEHKPSKVLTTRHEIESMTKFVTTSCETEMSSAGIQAVVEDRLSGKLGNKLSS